MGRASTKPVEWINVAKRTRKRRRHSHATGRSSLENPNVPLNLQSDEAFEAFGGSKSVSGVRVSRSKALGYPAVWRAVSLISGDVGKLPLLVYKQTGKNKQPDPKHPVYRLLLRKPNDAMTAFVFKQTLMLHVLTHGNGYAYIDRDGAGRATQLLLLDPDSCEPIRVNEQLWYLYTLPHGGETRKLPAEEVLHFKGLGFDGLRGLPVLKLARDALGAAIAARDHSARYFSNGARPGGVLEHPGKLTDQARKNMRESWDRVHRGLENAHKVAILEEGTKYNGFASNARDAQLLETREFDAREVANIFGVPTHKLGDPSKVAYNSLGEENQSYYDDTLSRWLKAISEECHDKLLSEQEKAKESHCVDFDYQEIQRANLPAQVDFADRLFRAGIINQDEARAIFSYNPAPDSKGQQFFVPNTLVPIEEAGEAVTDAEKTKPVKEEPPARKAIPAGLRAVVADVAGRMARRLVTHGEKAVRTGLDAWLVDGIRGHRGTVAEAFAPVVLAARDFGFNPPEAEVVADHLFERFAETAKADPPFDVAYCRDHIVTFVLRG